MADLNATLLDQALDQIGRRVGASDQALLAHQNQTARRFSDLQRLVSDGFVRFEDKLGERFDALYERFDQVCDKGGKEHAEFRTGILALKERLDAKDHQATGRSQVLGGLRDAGAWVVQNFWPIATISLLALSAAQNLPHLLDDEAAAEVIEAQVDASAHMPAGAARLLLPEEPQPLRGRLD